MTRIVRCFLLGPGILALIGMTFPALAQSNTGGEASFQSFKYLHPTIKDAPYYGETEMEFPIAQPDGQPSIKQKPIKQVWRDSEGRVRTEQRGLPVFQIDDPVAMYIYVVDTANRVVHRVKAEMMPQHAAGDAAQSGRSKPGVTTEYLGSKTIEGVSTVGTLTTALNPRTQRKTVRETWRSTALHLDLLTIETDQPDRPVITEIVNLTTAEPDAARFIVPANYLVVDETGDFSFKWGAQ
jgi:hypothetical protein